MVPGMKVDRLTLETTMVIMEGTQILASIEVTSRIGTIEVASRIDTMTPMVLAMAAGTTREDHFRVTEGAGVMNPTLTAGEEGRTGTGSEVRILIRAPMIEIIKEEAEVLMTGTTATATTDLRMAQTGMIEVTGTIGKATAISMVLVARVGMIITLRLPVDPWTTTGRLEIIRVTFKTQTPIGLLRIRLQGPTKTVIPIGRHL